MTKLLSFSTMIICALLAPGLAQAKVPAVCETADSDEANHYETLPNYGQMAKVIPKISYRATSALTCYTYSVDCPDYNPTTRGKECTMTTPKAGVFPVGTEVQMPVPGTFQKLSTVGATFIFVETGIKDCNLIKIGDSDSLQPMRADVPVEFTQGNLKKTAARYSLRQQNCILYSHYKGRGVRAKGIEEFHKEVGSQKAH